MINTEYVWELYSYKRTEPNEPNEPVQRRRLLVTTDEEWAQYVFNGVHEGERYGGQTVEGPVYAIRTQRDIGNPEETDVSEQFRSQLLNDD